MERRTRKKFGMLAVNVQLIVGIVKALKLRQFIELVNRVRLVKLLNEGQ
jgi:hypothetical protein